uniref:BMC domain-containing protein n=1 Tax=Desertifilum tharense IPPAS B-1220 TaxID=1781255 RepID=A0ACD5GVG0_9CYAN
MNRLENSLSGSALGMVSTRSFPAIIGVADTMIKSAGVVLVGIEKIGGVIVRRSLAVRIADIRIAVDAVLRMR